MPSPTINKAIFLVGFMGTGKSTVGALLAARCGRPFVDLDERIEAEAGATIKELFAGGEAEFREREAGVLQATAGQGVQVVAVGGGAVTHPGNLKLMLSAGVVVCLRATPDTILQRVGDALTRPLLAGAADKRSEVVRLLDAREPYYRQAHLTIDTDGVAPSQVASRIEAELCR
jgi:shikimate kinase